MKLNICQHGQEFLDRYQPVLLAHEVVYQLIMGNVLANRDTAAAPECFFGSVTDDDGRLLLIFCHVAPWRLLIHAMDKESTAEASALLAKYISEKNISIPGILASDAICQAFVSAESAHSYRRGISMDIMELRRLNNIALAPGRMRPAVEADLPLIVKWHQAFQLEATGHEVDYETSYEKNRNRINSFYLYEDPSGKVCAMAAITRVLTLGCCVSLVYTDPSERGKGYCAALMHLLAKQQLAQGAQYLGLFVDRANPISNHTYKKVGYEIIEDSIEYDRITN